MFIASKIKNRLIRAVSESGAPLGSGFQLSILTPEQLNQIRQYFKRPKFFILGHPRSGTTLLGRLIRLHPEVHCNWNARFFNWDGLVARVATPALDHWLARKGNHWVSQKDISTPLVRVMCDYIMESEAEIHDKWIVGDKTPNPNGAPVVDWMHRVYPDAHLIFIVRDGRNAVLSRRVRDIIEYPETLGRADLELRRKIRRDSRPYLKGERSIFIRPWLEREARSWADNVRESNELAKSLYGNRYLALRFEDLIDDTLGILTKVWEFLGVQRITRELSSVIRIEMEQNPTAEWQTEKDSDLLQGFRRGTRKGWVQVYTLEDKAFFDKVAGKELADWRYSS